MMDANMKRSPLITIVNVLQSFLGLVLGVPALITLVAAWGLWKRRFWGWALSLATDVGVLAVFVYNVVGENDREGDEIALAAGFVVPIVLLLLPVVRKFSWNAGTTTNLSS